MLIYYININGLFEKRYVFIWNFFMIKVFLLYLLVFKFFIFIYLWIKVGLKIEGLE